VANFLVRQRRAVAMSQAATIIMAKRENMNSYAHFNFEIGNYFDRYSSFGMPKLKTIDFELPKNFRLKAYRRTRIKNVSKEQDLCHFFINDESMLTAFSTPKTTVEYLKNYYAVLEPNYSVYTDWPLALSVFNTYRTRWCGRYWQENGLKVIPTVVWGLRDTYGFCFDGIPKNSIVAIRPPPNFGKGFNAKEITEYLDGLELMQFILKPKIIIAFGKLEKYIKKDIEVITVESKRKDSSILVRV